MYTFFERKYLPICDVEVLRSLGADDLLYNSKINIADYFSDDIEILKRRSIVFGDALSVRELYELLGSISKKLSGISDVLRSEIESGNKERSIFSAKQLELYFEIIHLSSRAKSSTFIGNTLSLSRFIRINLAAFQILFAKLRQDSTRDGM